MTEQTETYEEACAYYLSRFEDIARLIRVRDHAQELDSSGAQS